MPITLQFDFPSGEELRDAGMAQASDSADRNVPGWSEAAYNFLQGYCRSNRRFMAEDVRNAAAGFIPEPPSNRAWGPVFARARKAGLIRAAGFDNVKNAKAHCTPATVWEVQNKLKIS